MAISGNSVGFISVGYGNIVNIDRIVTISSANSAPAKRLISDARDNGRCIDVTQGRKTKSFIVLDSDHIVLSAMHVNTLAQRIENYRCGVTESLLDLDGMDDVDEEDD